MLLVARRRIVLIVYWQGMICPLLFPALLVFPAGAVVRVARK